MKGILILVFLMIVNLNIVAQPEYLNFRHITTDQGLSSNTITKIFQDSYGFIWIGTYAGVHRFDGITFKIYVNDPQNPRSLPHNIAESFYEDDDKVLYIGTHYGLCKYDRIADEFHSFYHDKNSILYNKYMNIRSIVKYKNYLLLGTEYGLYFFDPKKNYLKQYLTDSSLNSIRTSNIEYIYKDSKERIWIGTVKGIILFDEKNNNFKNIDKDVNGIKKYANLIVTSIIEDNEKNIWCGTTEGLFLVIEKNNQFYLKKFYFDAGKYSKNYNNIKCLFIDSEKNFWIGTENGGLNFFNKKNEEFKHFGIDENNILSLNNESIWTIYEDNNKNLWIGTFAGGINLKTINSNAFRLYSYIRGSKNGLSGNSIRNFLEEKDDKVWICIDGGGLNLLDLKTGKFEIYNMDNANFTSNAILSIARDKNSNLLWLSSWMGGIMLFDPNKKRVIKSYTTANSKIPVDNIYSIYIDEKDNNCLWLGTYFKGIVKFDIKRNEVEIFDQSNYSIGNNIVYKITSYKKDSLLIITPSSFDIFDKRNKKFISYSYANNRGISHLNVQDVFFENDTSIWIATEYGLNRFNPLNEKFYHYYIQNGLPSNNIRAIAKDKYSFLWVATNKGLCRFNPYTNESYVYTTEDGLQGNDFNIYSMYADTKGRIFVGGQKGFNIIYPEKIVINKSFSPIYITRIDIFNKPISSKKINKPIYLLDTLFLTYKDKVITFHFRTLDYSAPHKIGYKYKLENFDKNWQELSNKYDVTYTNLKPGKYVLKIISTNSNGIWNSKSKDLHIIVKPPFYDTVVFKTIVLLITILLIYLYFIYKTRKINRQRELLEKLVNERTLEIQEKNELLLKQRDELNKINAELEERQFKIMEQAEELRVQKENLESLNLSLQNMNNLLEERQQQIVEQSEELKRLNSSKDKLISVIAHDLRNPLNTLMGFSEILVYQYNNLDDEKKLKFLKIIHTTAKNMFLLLENLLQWARAQTHSISFNPEIFSINELIDENIALFHEQAFLKNNVIKNNVDEDLKVYADRNMINTVIRNILSNAIKFTENGVITIDIEKFHDYIKIKISDTGKGIPHERLSNLFDVTVSSTTSGTRGETGTGLGLLLCKEFVEKNNGRIEISSKVGEGTTVSFTLPLSNNN